MGEVEKVKIKRELWNTSKGKKYIVVARNSKGNVIARRPWSKKDNVQKFKRIYGETGTFSRDTNRLRANNGTREVTDYSDKPKIPTGRMFMYSVTGITKKGETITARSMLHPKGYSMESARAEALTSFYERVSQKLNPNSYDEDEGRAIARRGYIVRMKEGITYYDGKN